MAYNGEAYAVYELPDGTQVLVDGDGNTVANLDDIDPDTFYDLAWETEVYYVPQGPPSYDTLVYDADTDELLVKVNTGSETLGIQEGYTGTDAAEIYSTYHPPGADYYLVLDADGNVIDQQEIPPQEVWSVLGVVTYYDDGGVVVDVGVAELEVDVIGPEGGISFSVGDMDDLFEGADWLGSVGAGMEWDEDGVAIYAEADISEFGYIGAGMEVGKDGFEQWVSAEFEIPTDVFDIGMAVDSSWGITEKGQIFAGADVEMDFTVPGGPDIGLGVNGYVEVGPDGFELTGGVGRQGGHVRGIPRGRPTGQLHTRRRRGARSRTPSTAGSASRASAVCVRRLRNPVLHRRHLRGHRCPWRPVRLGQRCRRRRSRHGGRVQRAERGRILRSRMAPGASRHRGHQGALRQGPRRRRGHLRHPDRSRRCRSLRSPRRRRGVRTRDAASTRHPSTTWVPGLEREPSAAMLRGDDDIPPMLRQVMERRVINTEHTPLGYEKLERTVRDASAPRWRCRP